MNEEGKPVTRRQFLEMVGAAGGAAAVYETMVAMGMLAVPAAYAGPPDVSAAPATDRTIAVLGAGVAGLTAALRLKGKARVTVYEASDRIGGRNFTVSSSKADRRNVIRQDKRDDQVCTFAGSPESQYFEAGCGRIPYHHVSLLELCRELKVPLQPYIMETRANRFQADGAFDNHSVENRQVANDTRGYIAELLAKAINKKCLDDSLSEADRKALLSLLSTFGNISDKTEPPYAYLGSTRSGYQQDPGVTSPGTPVPPLALDQLLKSRFWAHRFYQAEDYLWQTTLFHPVGGMRRIVDALHAAIGLSTVQTGKVATRISRAGGKVQITFADKTSVTADYCISTIPLPILKGLLDDSFSGDYRDAVKAVEFAKTCKVGWQATERFWEKLRGPDHTNGPQIFGGISWIAHPITQMWYPSADYFAPGPAVLTGAYNYDSKDNPVASRFGAENLPTRLKIGLEGGERLHPEFRKYVPVDKGLSIAWQEVPHIGGGWAEWDHAKEAHKTAYNRLLRPDGPFIVAGDQASYLPGWMEGAVLSAYHVVPHALGLPIPEAMERLQDLPAPDSRSVTGAG